MKYIALALLCAISVPVLAADRVIPEPKAFERYSGQLRMNLPIRIESGSQVAKDVVAKKLQSMGVQITDDVSQRAIICRIELSTPHDSDPISIEAQTYELVVNSDGLTIKAGGLPGLDYALATLEQLRWYDGYNTYFPYVTIKDAPSMPLRSVYLNLRQVKATEPESMEVLKGLIDTLASLKINGLVVEVSDNVRYDSRRFPVREETAFSKQQVQEFVAYARSRHMEVIPYLQTLSHVAWILSNPENEALLEDPTNKGWHTAWCPSKPETQAFIEDILEETVEIFQPRFVHVGLDEVNWGPYYRCDDCRKREEPSEIFLDQILQLHGFLAERDVRMIMFHDELLEVPNRYSRYSKTAEIVEGWKVVDHLPRDIVLNTYFYSEDRPELKRQVDLFTSQGFQVIGMPFNIFKGIKQKADRMGQEPGSLGNILSYWHFAGDWSLYAIAPESAASTTLFADMCWNPSVELESLGYDPVWEFTWRWKNLNPAAGGKRLASYPLEISGLLNQNIFSARGNWPETATHISEFQFEGDLVLDEMQFVLGGGQNRPNGIVLSGAVGDGFTTDTITIGVHRPVKGLAFSHASDVPANIEALRQRNRHTPEIALYTFVYEDGTRVEQPIQYRVHITDWNNRLAPIDGRVAIDTHDDEGNRVMFTRWIWINPYPEKILQHIELVSKQYEDASVAVLAISALSNERVPVPIDEMNYTTEQEFLDVWKMRPFGLGRTPQLTMHPDKHAMEIQVPPVGESQARLILDRDIQVNLEQATDRTLALEIYLDYSSTIQGALYLAEQASDDDEWGRSAVTFLRLRPGMNRVSIIPERMNASGEPLDWEKVFQLRLSFWFPPKSSEMRLIISDIQWQPITVRHALHKGAWYE